MMTEDEWEKYIMRGKLLLMDGFRAGYKAARRDAVKAINDVIYDILKVHPQDVSRFVAAVMAQMTDERESKLREDFVRAYTKWWRR